MIRTVASLLSIGLCLTPLCSHALQMLPMSIEQLTTAAQIVLRGKVLTKTCQRDPEGRVYTRVELQVLDVWKGSVSSARFTVVHSGGILGTERSVTPGQVEYRMNEEVVAFLVSNDRGEGVTLSLSQGKFQLWKDEATGTHYTWNLFHGAPPPSSSKATLRDLASRDLLTLDELRRRVTESLR